MSETIRPESDSQRLGTQWRRFFRRDEQASMDGFDTTVDEPRGGTSREWELFCREAPAEPLVHVGSVSAPSEAIAREQATQLFDHAADALWLCPAEETLRLRREALASSGDGTDEPADETPRRGEDG